VKIVLNFFDIFDMSNNDLGLHMIYLYHLTSLSLNINLKHAKKKSLMSLC